ncbi:MAG: hypothetical protein WBD41_12765 [Rhodococcus sp. (in: high G+C Gram-positive bacteria)]|jgi:DNA-binding phage protein|uniref:hypothetical protein n=1 Tax=Rhodococcus sp. EPR-157 TaxID=1813677 RepID=UPI0007BBE1CE|nr:hypothetical protein [Rhodococcus sp. EPR-157]KZF12661.1 hypothetical protein A2J03_17405 [Rhodococcus sp. EPR-157]
MEQRHLVPHAQFRPPRHRRLLAAIRAFGGMVKAATKEWLVRETLDRDLTEDLLVDALLSVIERVLLDEPQ